MSEGDGPRGDEMPAAKAAGAHRTAFVTPRPRTLRTGPARRSFLIFAAAGWLYVLGLLIVPGEYGGDVRGLFDLVLAWWGPAVCAAAIVVAARPPRFAGRTGRIVRWAIAAFVTLASYPAIRGRHWPFDIVESLGWGWFCLVAAADMAIAGFATYGLTRLSTEDAALVWGLFGYAVFSVLYGLVGADLLDLEFAKSAGLPEQADSVLLGAVGGVVWVIVAWMRCPPSRPPSSEARRVAHVFD